MAIGIGEKRDKKVVLLTPAFGKGGAEKQLFKLAKYLDEIGFDVLIISLYTLNMFSEELKETGITFTSLALDRKKSNIFKYPKLVRTFKPDILISFMYTANILGRFTKLFYRCAIISSVRNEKFGGAAREFLFRLTNVVDSCTTTNSESVLQKLIKRKVLDPRKSFSIGNIINLPVVNDEKKVIIRKNFREEFGIKDDEFLFLFVGHCRPQKDYENLFQATKLIGASFKVIMIGNLLGQTWPLERIIELGLDKQIRFLDKRDDIERFYLSADSLVMSSLWEGLPNAIMEAMSYGLPVVSTNVGGVEDLVDNGHNGLICEPGNPVKLAGIMKQMMDFSSTERIQIGKSGINKIKNEFNADVILNKWNNAIINNL